MPKNVNLITALAEKSWTARELAKRSGVSYPTISRLLNLHNTPTAPTARAICRVLGKPRAALFPEVHVPGEQHKRATA